MSETKFTKGEWCIRLVNGQFTIMRHDTGYGICSTVMCDDTDKANAYLMAAAPEMYKEIEDDIKNLKLLLMGVDPSSLESAAIEKKIHRKQKLLAKARGEK